MRLADRLAAKGQRLAQLRGVLVGGAPSYPAMVARYAAGFGTEPVRRDQPSLIDRWSAVDGRSSVWESPAP